MATRATLADGTTFDYDEETQAHPTHVNDQPVVSRRLLSPAEVQAAADAQAAPVDGEAG